MKRTLHYRTDENHPGILLPSGNHTVSKLGVIRRGMSKEEARQLKKLAKKKRKLATEMQILKSFHGLSAEVMKK